MAVAAFLSSCSSEPVTIKEGEGFDFEGQNITVNLSAFSILSNDEEETSLIAPDGKIYLMVDTKASEDNYFMFLKDGETEIEAVDYTVAKYFLESGTDMLDPNKHELYLVDKSNTNYTVEIKSYGGDIATLAVGQLSDETTLTLHASMQEFVNSFNDGARISEVVQNFVPQDTTATDFIVETGMEITSDPIVKGLEISYIIDANTYECTSEFGIDKMTVTWSGDFIKSVVFE